MSLNDWICYYYDMVLHAVWHYAIKSTEFVYVVDSRGKRS